MAGRSAPFHDICFPQKEDLLLSAVVERELKRKKPNTDIVIARDLKSAKSESGTDVDRLFDLPISSFFTLAGPKSPKALHVVFQPHTPPPPRLSLASVLMQNARPKVLHFQSKYSKQQVDEFLHGYKVAESRVDYLKNIVEKPDITEQCRAYAVQFCNDNHITYKFYDSSNTRQR